MIRPLRIRRPLLVGLLLGASCANGWAQSDTDVKGELREVRERIDQIQVRLVKERAAESTAAAQLAEREKRIGELAQRVSELDADTRSAEARLTKLDEEQRVLTADLSEQRQNLGLATRLAWLSGRRSELQQFLEAGTPDRVGRGIAYQSYFYRAGRVRVDALSDELSVAVDLARKLNRQRAEFTVLEGQLKTQIDALEEERLARKKILDDATRIATSSNSELQNLGRDVTRLETLLAELRAALADIPEDADRDAAFETRRGKLAWPVVGETTVKFGASRGGGLRWKGILINAPRGQAVRAVAAGRVAFAEWLRGFGLLAIVDHGNGYLTLYGFNESLYKEAGEWIAAGEQLASVGTSGGRREPGLYFELRHQGKAVNPSRWLQRNPK